MRVLPLSKRQKREVWAILPFPKGMRAATGEGLAQETVGMDGCPVSVFPCPLRYSPSRGHAAFLRVPTTRERQKLRGFNPCGVCATRSPETIRS